MLPPANLHQARPELIGQALAFLEAGIHLNDGYQPLKQELDDLCVVLCAGEPDGSEHYVSYDSKTLKEAAFRLEQPSSCFYQAIMSKGGRVTRGDADRKYRAGAHDAVALSLINNIAPKPSAMGLPDGI